MGLAAGTPFWWLDLPTLALVGACLGLLLLFVAVGGLLKRARSRADEELRALLLDQLAFACRRGLPLEQALLALAEDLERRAGTGPRSVSTWRRLFGPSTVLWLPTIRLRRARALAFDVAAGLQEGSLGRGLGRAPGAFPDPWPQVLERARESGTLLAAVEALREHDACGARARSLIRGALVYPAATLLMLQVPLWVYTSVTRQRLMDMLSHAEAPLPGSLVALLVAQPLLLVAVPVLLFVAWAAGGLLAARPGEDGAQRWFPGVRVAWRDLQRARFARLLGACVRAGLPAHEALELLAPAGPVSEPALRAAAAQAREGRPLLEALAASGALGERALPQLAGGEASALAAAAARATAEHERRVRALAAWTFPLALLAIGALVACHYWAPFLSVMHLTGGIPW